MNNQMVLGVGLFFHNEQEYSKFKICKVILIEGFIALDKTNNTYGVDRKLYKDDVWKVEYANTFRMKKNDNIINKAH